MAEAMEGGALRRLTNMDGIHKGSRSSPLHL